MHRSASKTPMLAILLLVSASCTISTGFSSSVIDTERCNHDSVLTSSDVVFGHSSAGDADVLSVDNIPAYELQALQDFYESTNGEGWTWDATLGNKWNFSANANPCIDDWQGIVCDNATSSYHVTSITLEKMNLVGYIPESFGSLSELLLLDIPNNFISGLLPQSFSTLANMEFLTLANNYFEGELPEYFSQWSQLRYLEVEQNIFEGTIPTSYCQLSQLIILNVGINYLEGTIPDCYENMTHLKEISWEESGLHGPLPLSLGNLTNIKYIYANSNKFTGPIPACYGNLTQLITFTLFDNLITGSLPATFSALTQLQFLFVGQNDITGTIPEFVGSMTQLLAIDFSLNPMNGSLPNSLGNLVQLERVYMYSSGFTGTVPASFGNWTNVWYLGLYSNALTGSLPSSLGNLVVLEYFEFNNNNLDGHIPDIFDKMPYMYVVDVSLNAFTGPLPPSLATILDVSFIVLQVNYLTGSLPAGLFDNYHLLYSFEVDGNRLTGTLPDSLGRLGYLSYFNVADNDFSGSIPETLGQCTDLQFIYMGANYLTGTVPAALGSLYYLLQLDLSDNWLVGTVPAALGAAPYVQGLSLQTNMLTGPLPSTFSQWAYLIQMILNNNHFTGSLDPAFNATMQYELSTVVLNNNRFSGTLPSELFRLGKLDSFSGVTNCFHGELPPVICNSTTLATLALDGLSSATSCRNTLFPGASGSYVLTRSVGGTVPSCLYKLPRLTTLHLSGNDFTGSLPAEMINPFLIDLSLSHNVLTGKIPAHMQRRQWYNLDLSYNRLTGTLRSDFQTGVLNGSYYKHLSDLIGLNFTLENAQSSLSLENNRLSGYIPPSVQNKVNVSILGSNLFTCNFRKTDLPHHDHGRGNYQCDSQEFNVPYYIWLSVVATFLVGLFVVWRFQQRIVESWGIDYALGQIVKWYYVLEIKTELLDPKRRLPAYLAVVKLSDGLCKIAVYCTLFIFVALLPLLASTSAYYGTFTHKYAWAVSAAYTSGVVPGMLIMIFLIGLMVLTIAAFQQIIHQFASSGDHHSSVAQQKKVLPSLNVMFIYAAFIAANIMAVVGANIAYVYVAIYGHSSVLLLAQLALSLFKLFWNRFFSVFLVRWAARVVTTRDNATKEVDPASPPELQLVSLQVFVALLNNIAIPCLVVAVISPSCFFNVFVGAPKIDTVYTYSKCAAVKGAACDKFAVGSISTSYSPPFTYNYQCSSSFITYYAPAFVLLCMMSTFLTPVLQYFLYVLHRRALPHSDSSWFKLLDMLLPAHLMPVDSESVIVSSLYKPYFDANQMILSLITFMGLLLTFGAVFPPVAIALLAALLSVLYFNKLKLGRFLTIATEKGLFGFVDIVEVESKRAGFLPVLERSLWMLITISCWFYTLFLFDTLGDAVGFGGAYWVLIVMPLMPLVLYAMCVVWKRLYTLYFARQDTGHVTEDTEQGSSTFNIIRASEVELTVVGQRGVIDA